MSTSAITSSTDQLQRIEELGRIILAYSEVMDKLQRSHEQLTEMVATLQAELGEKNKLLERKERLAALGEMAAGMAHEIRNPLGGIHLYASLLAKDVAAMPQSLQLVNKISGGVRRLEGLVSQVLHFTREIQVTRAETDLAAIIETAIDLAQPKIAERAIDVQVRGERPLPARVDEHLLGQAVLNLLLNSVEAMDHGGTLSVQFARAIEQDGEGRQVKLTIRDSGPGIPPTILDRIFNPFFTTKETGTGLGLAIVHRIVDAHEGTITVTNPPGGGAQFEIRI
jgi:two-component system sensor histidine kinase HydH